MVKKSENIRHILPLSGGKDSAALAVYLKDKIPNLEYVFLDTGHELPETYEFLDRMRAVLGIDIVHLKSKRDFNFWLNIFKGCLPSPQNRWCTRELKLVPYEKYIGSDKVISYVALRADEDRTGYISHKPNVVPMYPFIEDGLVKEDILTILRNSGLGLPGYYSWRSRSGCYFCFFQRRIEWVRLAKIHPDLFERAAAYETNHADGRIYTWIEGTFLKELVKDADRMSIAASPPASKKITYNRSAKLIDSMSELKFEADASSIVAENTEDSDNLFQGSKPCLICDL